MSFYLLFPFASAGAIEGHSEHNFEEQGMSLRKYISLTTFCTLPLFVDLTKVLLEMALLWESELKLRFRLFIVPPGLLLLGIAKGK